MTSLSKSNFDKTILVISDIHLGAGEIVNGKRNLLEDFHYDKELIEFLDYYSRGFYSEKEVELIINGDFLDFLAVPFVEFFDDEFWSEEAALEKLSSDNGAVYKHIYELSNELMEGFRKISIKYEQPMIIQGPGPTFSVSFTDAEEMGELARVLNQDTYNLPKIQKGVKAKAQPTVFLSSYAESKVRHFHNLYNEWLSIE